MPRLRKFIIPKQLHFVTTAVEQGIVFPPNELINGIVKSCIARAQELYPVTICKLIMSTTHAHLMLMTDYPDDIPGFMERFKTESAHAINKLLGLRKRTIWCHGYDSPLIYKDLDKAIEKIAYIYANPAKDGLVDTIDQYPGVSTWGIEDDQTLECSMIPRSKIKQLPSSNMSAYFRAISKTSRKGGIAIKPNAWMEAFGITPADQRSVNERINKRVREMELEARAARGTDSVIGKKKLIETPICAPFTPNRTGRRSYIICGDIELRKLLLQNLKELIGRAKEVYHRWKHGDYSMRFPMGLFPPRMPRVASPISLEAALSLSL